MPIFRIEEGVTPRTEPSLILGEPLLWDSDRLSASCGELAFTGLSDRSHELSADECAQITYWHKPRNFMVNGVTRGIIFIRINFMEYDAEYGHEVQRSMYMKSYGLQFLAFLMGTHPRLGADSAVSRLPDAGILEIIARKGGWMAPNRIVKDQV